MFSTPTGEEEIIKDRENAGSTRSWDRLKDDSEDVINGASCGVLGRTAWDEGR